MFCSTSIRFISKQFYYLTTQLNSNLDLFVRKLVEIAENYNRTEK